MKVLKFGGTSVGTPKRMQKLIEIIVNQNTSKTFVVLSAISGVTNDLQSIADLLITKQKLKAKELIQILKKKHLGYAIELLQTPKAHDTATIKINTIFQELNAYLSIDFHKDKTGNILAFGEILSTTLFQTYLLEKKLNSTLLYAPDFISIDENQQPAIQNIRIKLKQIISKDTLNNIFITQGFICTNHKNKIDNLQRGGSDYTASIIGATLGAKEIQIWTDIDGFHNNDPRYVNNTSPIRQLSFDEAAELAYFGAKILHPQSIHPAKKYNIPVRLLDTSAPELPGTRIVGMKTNKNKIVAIAAKDGITAIRIQSSRMLMAYGFLRRVFEVFEKFKTSIDMITTSEVAVSLTIDSTEFLEDILIELQNYGQVHLDKNQSIICVVGNFSGYLHGQATIVSEVLKHLPIRMISYGGSEHNISMLLPQQYKKEALRSLHSRFF